MCCSRQGFCPIPGRVDSWWSRSIPLHNGRRQPGTTNRRYACRWADSPAHRGGKNQETRNNRRLSAKLSLHREQDKEQNGFSRALDKNARIKTLERCPPDDQKRCQIRDRSQAAGFWSFPRHWAVIGRSVGGPSEDFGEVVEQFRPRLQLASRRRVRFGTLSAREMKRRRWRIVEPGFHKPDVGSPCVFA